MTSSVISSCRRESSFSCVPVLTYGSVAPKASEWRKAATKGCSPAARRSANSSPMDAITSARGPKQSIAPHFANDSTARRLSADQSTASQKASMPENLPPDCRSRTAITDRTAASPTFLMAPRPNRTPAFPAPSASTVNSTWLALTSGGKTGIEARRHSTMLKTIFSVLPISVDISAAGNVGLGTASPSVKLNVVGSDGTTTQVLVQENNATASGRDLLRLENKGPTRLRLKNTNTNNEWSLNAHDSDFRMTPAGSATVAMTIFPTGNVTIAGTLTQNSDRNSKENFRTLDHKALLQKIASLDITEWNFKSENKDVRHIGPMAQDFHASFGLGEREDRIAPLDTSGVALAAIQGLQQELSERDRRIAELEARLERLDSLTQRLARERVERTAALPASNNCDAQTVAAGL